MLGGIERVVIDAEDEGGVSTLGWGGDDNAGRAGLDVHGGLVAVGEDAGGLDHDIDAEVAPREGFGIALGKHLEGVRPHGDAVAGDLDLFVEDAVGRVVLEQVGVDLGRGQVVDGDQIDVGSGLPRRPVEVATDAAEAVDANPYCHCQSPPVFSMSDPT